jgi:DNA-binding LytR/AlgR family response regulator
MDQKVNILIVEDEGIVAMELQESLQKEGFEVAAIVDNGQEAIDLVKDEAIDLVLLDINIKGGWDGIETATQLRKLKNIPFIFVTAYADSNTFERARATMPSAYLIKPFRINDLRKAIELAMFNFSQQQEANQPVKEKPAEKKEPAELEGILHFNNSIFIKQNYKYNKIACADITYLKADGNYTFIQTISKRYIVKYSLQSVIDVFNTDKFIRVHRSFAVNMDHITSFNENAVFLGEEEIPMGRNYKDTFMQLFRQL